MTSALVLVIDDEPQMVRSLRLMLNGSGYEVMTATSGTDAINALEDRIPDVVLLDLMLPGMSGLEVLDRIRPRCGAAVIVLSARGEEAMKVSALERGADDYVTKPFGAQELLARIKVALRHRSQIRFDTPFEAGDLRIDFGRRLVTVSGEPVALTPKEFDVLKYLASAHDKVLTHKTILRNVWGTEYAGESQYLRNIILGLRRKLEPNPRNPRYILTEPGVGYRFAT